MNLLQWLKKKKKGKEKKEKVNKLVIFLLNREEIKKKKWYHDDDKLILKMVKVKKKSSNSYEILLDENVLKTPGIWITVPSQYSHKIIFQTDIMHINMIFSVLCTRNIYTMR